MKKKSPPLGTTKSSAGVFHSSIPQTAGERVPKPIPPPGSLWSTTTYKDEDVRFLRVLNDPNRRDNVTTLPHGTIILVTGSPIRNYIPFLGPDGTGFIAGDWWAVRRILPV